MVVQISKINNIQGILIVSLAVFLGSYIPGLISNKFERDRAWVFDIIPESNELGKQFADKIREMNIPIHTFKGYNDKLELVLCAKVFSMDKDQSRLISALIPENFKYHVVELKNYIK